MSDPINLKEMPDQAKVIFKCKGKPVGKMRNELTVDMVSPLKETFELATDEGSFHGGDATAPPPLALFIASITGCIMTQIRAFSKRLKIQITDLNVEAKVTWNWKKVEKIYETSPEKFEMDIYIDSSESIERVKTLVQAAKKGCFIEQTLSQKNTINHKLKIEDKWIDL